MNLPGRGVVDPNKVDVDGRIVTASNELESLLTWLRTTVGQFSVKAACETGHCGACTVLVDGCPTLACCLPAAAAAGTSVETPGRLAQNASGRLVAEAFANHDVPQCGFCIPGLLVSTVAWLREGPTRSSARQMLSGHLCRCSGYMQAIETLEVLALEGDRQNLQPGASVDQHGRIERVCEDSAIEVLQATAGLNPEAFSE
jgi:carbon-monoxide dehydrogenase small subunit